MENNKILIVDDEQEMRQLIQLHLHREGFSVLKAADADEALDTISRNNPQLILLDVMMPKIDGFSLAKKIKEINNIPIIFLTARGDEWDKIHGLQIGADDYIVKPFSPGELIARIEAVLRRTNNNPSVKESHNQKFGPLIFEERSRKVYCNNNLLTLTLKEYELLYFLAIHQSQVFSREQLLERIWGIDYIGSERTVDTHIKTLRLKLTSSAKIIQTVWGVGYKFEVE